ncbi:MAG: restriction endonuclease [Chthoniobacterales bacterium]|nr:restriction endonuclease [Chthoniobacterales bacterium]
MSGKPSAVIDTRVIYCGDNLEQLRKLPEACVDLIYIDPPFNSNRNYEVFWGETKEKRSFEDRHESTRAYIDYMRPRCEQLARVLKKTGSFYYHCDWHASHYVKVMLDGIFGENNFINEIVWKRSTSHNDAKQGSKHFGRLHDVLFLYCGGSNEYTWNTQYVPLDESYIASHYTNTDADGRRFRWDNLTGPGGAAKGNPLYEVLGVKKHWRYTNKKMEQLVADGIVAIPPKGSVPALKRYLDASKGLPVGSVWDDIFPVNSQAKEALGYPTQKPLPLLERVLLTSSNENDIVLDAFCGCGTAIVAAQKLKRQWIGIDISPTACRVMAKRLKDKKVCALPENEDLWAIGRGFIVRDLPWTEKKLRELPPFEFENWAVIALGGRKNKAQVGDKGIDGRIFPVSALDNVRVAEASELALEERFYAMQVKQKDKAGRPDIDAFETAMRRAKCEKGFFVSFDYSSDALREIDRFFREEHRIIVPLTVGEILDEEIAKKLA